MRIMRLNLLIHLPQWRNINIIITGCDKDDGATTYLL